MPIPVQRQVTLSVKVPPAQFVLFVVNEATRMWIEILTARGLGIDKLLNQRAVFNDQLHTWLTARCIRAVYLDVYEPGSSLIAERWGLSFLYEDPSGAPWNSESDGLYEGYYEQIKGMVAHLGTLPEGARYRMVADLTMEML